MTEDADIFPLAEAVLASVVGQLALAGLPVVDAAFVAPGNQAAMDYACEGGQAWVRIVSAYTSTTFPEPDQSAQSMCVGRPAALIEVGVARCAPEPTQTMGVLEAPAPEVLTESARVQSADREAMRRGIIAGGGDDVIIGSYTPLGPQGGIVGGFWRSYIGA